MTKGLRIQTIRKNKGLTQEEVADITGLTVRTIQRIESDVTNPRPYTLKAISDALGVSFDDLFQPESHSPSDLTQAPAPSNTPAGDSRHFMQVFFLSGFLFMLFPLFHFIFLKKFAAQQKTLPPELEFTCNNFIIEQLFWSISFVALYLITVFANLFIKKSLHSSEQISYFIPLVLMYLINAFLILLRFFKFEGNSGAGGRI